MHMRPKGRGDGLVIEAVGDELVVYDERSQTAHGLSPEAAAVWRSCDGSRSSAEIAEEVGLEQAVVDRALAELRAGDLLEEEITVRPGYSRREAAVRMARIGGAAFVAPFVYSVSVASAATCVCSPNAKGCTATGSPSTNCQGTGGTSGAKGTGCDCCTCVCYEGTGDSHWCVTSTCVAGGSPAPGGNCAGCCSGACAGHSTTCSSGNPT